MNEEEEDKFLKENPIVFKKYQVKRKLGEGAFGEVYLGQSIANKSYVALKVEPKKIAKPILQSEAFLIYSLAGVGIPEVLSFGKVKNYNVLVEPLLGKSLFDIFAENHKEMPFEDICLIGQQIIDRIQWVHSKYIVHRDIKPDNFLVGREDPNVIYLIDFGLSKKYRSSNTGKHIRFGFTGKLTGTVRFASANALRGGEQSRRDDIESIGYMLVYFMKKRLPWQGVTGTRKMERYLKIYKMKKNTSPEELCKDLPPEMVEYMTYAKKMEFEQEPNYNYLRNLFKKMLKRIHNSPEILVFSWINLGDLAKLKKPVNPSSRRESPQARLYKKIKNSLEREKNLSTDSNNSKRSYQQVFAQAKVTNMKVLNQNNFTESELEQKNEKKVNKKLLKAKEELNTMIANLDTFVDENAVDFDNEVLLRGSKDCGEITSKNTLDNINKINYKIQSDNNNININKEPNNDLFDKNLNPEQNKNNLYNNNKNIINNYLEKFANNNEPNENDKNKIDLNKIETSKDIKELVKNLENKENKEDKEDKEGKEDKEIKEQENNKINTTNINNQNKKSSNKNSLNNNLNQIENNNPAFNKPKNKLNPIFDSINNIFFENSIPLKQNTNNNSNQLEPINENNNENNKNNIKIDSSIKKENSGQIQGDKNNNENKVSLKISNLDGKEFTFNESLNFKSNIKFDNAIKEIIPEKNENLLSADKMDNDYNYFKKDKNIPDNLNEKNNSKNIINQQNLLKTGESKSNQNKMMKNKKSVNQNQVKNKNNINNKAFNNNKLNDYLQNQRNNPQKLQNMIDIENDLQKRLSQEQKIMNNNMNFPNDNDINNFVVPNNKNQIQNKENKTKIIDLDNLNNNIIKNPTNPNNNKYIIANRKVNYKPNYNNSTFENNVNFMQNEGMINNLNNKPLNYAQISKKNLQIINKQRKDNLDVLQNKKLNLGNNITNININIKNNIVQKTNNSNNNMKIVNLNKKNHPNMTKNFTTGNLNTNFLNNNIIATNFQYSPKNQKQKQFLNPNMMNLHPNEKRILNNKQNSQKNNINIMINNPNNINIKKLNNNFNRNNMPQNQLQTNPNFIQPYPNSVQNALPTRYVYTTGNKQISPKAMKMINPNINYGHVMQSQIPVNNYTNNIRNMGNRYNNYVPNNNGNIQNLKINKGNYQMYTYQ